MTPTPITQAVEWPKVTVGGRSITLRYSFAAGVILGRWGKSLFAGNATNVDLAAAMAGSFDEHGKWHSIGYERSIDLADEVLDAEAGPLMEGVSEALKKAFPGVTFQSEPGAMNAEIQTNPEKTDQRNDTSASGPSPDQP